MRQANLVLVTGMSGAGKSSAMSILEDMGYHCIDQFPVQLVSQLSDLFSDESDPRYRNVAIATSALDYPEFLEYFENIGAKVRVIFLDAANETLLRRYKFTRRQHPFMIFRKASTLEEAIDLERECFNQIQESENLFKIDTTTLNQSELKKKLEEMMKLGHKPVFSISFESFGYKNGVPRDSDLLLDVRFLPNPYYIPELKHKTGNDQPVYDYVMNCPETQQFLHQLIPFLDYLLPQYQKEGKTHLTVGIGCTGGHHRSITLVNYLHQYYSARWICFKSHRDEFV